MTPYGVVYDNGLKLEEVYDGRHLPGYHYEQDMLAVGISSRTDSENSSKITWLYLPCSQAQVERGMMRSGISDPDDMRIWYEDSRSLLARLELARSRGLAGISLWPQDRLYRPGLHTLQSRCTGEKLG